MDDTLLYGASPTAERAILLLNLGSPERPTASALRTYLEEFLMDRRVVGLPDWARSLVVKRLIVPHRSPRSAEAYRTIWDEQTESFPLITHTQALARQLAELRGEPVAVGMRYGHPSTAEALQALAALPALSEVILLPLYPHYAQSSYETAVAYVLSEAQRLGLRPLRYRLVPPFYQDAGYRRVLADQVRPYLTESFDKLIVSMHGVPVTHLPKACRHDNGQVGGCADRRSSHEQAGITDCYRLQCEETMRQLRDDLGLAPERAELVYQSRLGFHEWMRPYMSRRVREWSAEGVERLVVVCPGFVCDCLETLQEIDDFYHKEFLARGGKRFTYVPCLNDSPAFVRVLSDLITASAAREGDLLTEANWARYCG